MNSWKVPGGAVKIGPIRALAPSGRRRRPVLFGAAVAALVMLAAGCGGGQRVAAPPAGAGTRVSGSVPAGIRSLPLIDQNGDHTSLAAFTGKIVVISDSMTLCQETCPLDTANIVQTARDADRQQATGKVEFLTITVDPNRDTPAQLAAYRRMYDPPANWQMLTGSKATITKLWKYFGVWYQKVPQSSKAAKNWRTGQRLTYDINHADETFFLDGHGNERFVLDGAAHVEPGTMMPGRIKRFLDADGRHNLQDPEQDAWTIPQALNALSWLLQRKLNAPSG